MGRNLRTSAHLLEMFMPYRSDEARMIDVLRKAVEFDFYRGVELGIFFDPTNRKTVRGILEENHLHGTTFVTPYVKDQKLSLSDLETQGRRKAVDLVKELAGYAADAGYTNFCVPSGDDPGPVFRGLAKLALTESMVEIAERCRSLGMNLMLEPLDRYAYKKQLIGPIEEAAVWFAPIHEECPNAYLHWDSAHEALGGADLMKSIETAAPFLAQMHLCNAILDPGHPCYGDLHMDVGEAPDFETEGFLTPQVGAQILKKTASFDPPQGIAETFVSVEVLGHPGDNLWLKERTVREFLARCFALAGMDTK